MADKKASEIKKGMNILEAMSIFPKISTILTQNQIKSLKVFENLEKNILDAGKNPDEILEQINKEFRESKKPVKMDMENILDVTEEAVEELKKLMENKGKKGWSVRVLVHSPSPNKHSYAMDFEKRPAKDDVIIKKHGLKFFVSKKHLDNIKNIKLDFEKKENGFKFNKNGQ